MNISIPDLQKNSRKREYVYARHMFKILVSCGSSLSMATIGSMAGMKEHSSIIHSKDNLSGLLTDHHFRDPLSIVLKRIEKDGRFKKEIMKMITERPELEDFFEKKPMYEREEIFHKMNAFLHEHGAIILMDAFPGFFEKSFPGEKIPALIPIS